MDFLKKWLPLIGYKTAINLFLISLYPFLFFVLSSINSYVSSLIRFQIRTLTVSECFAWLFIVAIALSVYLGAVFIVKALYFSKYFRIDLVCSIWHGEYTGAYRHYCSKKPYYPYLWYWFHLPLRYNNHNIDFF